MTRTAQLEKALRDLLMEPSGYTRAAARDVLGICHVCNRDKGDPCGLCSDGINEDREYREMMNERQDC